MRINLINLVLLISLPAITMAANIALPPATGQGSTVPNGCPGGCYPSPSNSDGALQNGVAWPTPRFIVDTTGDCIIDKLTGLMWVRNLNSVNGGASLNWTNALNIAESGTWCGYSDWRTPNINELRSLINYGESNTVIWLNTPLTNGGGGFSNINSVESNNWTSSILSSGQIWIVTLSVGTTITASKSSSTPRLFPVRGGM